MKKINLEKRILEKIKKDNLKPKSRLFFMFKNIFWWTLTVFFVLFSALSFASILYKISGNLDIVTNFSSNYFSSINTFFYLLPFFWFITLALFIYLSILNYKKTKLFYRRNVLVVVMSMLVLSFVLGSVLFNLGLAKKTEEFTQKYIPFYKKYKKFQEIKKDIFTKKLKEIGITKDLLEKSPELREHVENKFYENVLGKTYLFRSPNICVSDSFICTASEVFFKDDRGCGCREIYSNINDL